MTNRRDHQSSLGSTYDRSSANWSCIIHRKLWKPSVLGANSIITNSSIPIPIDCSSIRYSQYHYLPFYRTMLCVSAVFAVAQCPSITFVYCINSAEDIIKLLSQPGRPIILVIWPHVLIHNSKGIPFSRDTKYTGVGKICIFRLKSLLILEMVQDRPIVDMEH